MDTYDVEITDTFGGDANYCWVRRYRVRARSHRGAMRAAANRYGARGWVGDGNGRFADTVRYDLRGCAICAFVELADDAE